MKIGIPRAGLYYNYFPFWQAFFETLGFEVVLSPKTDNRILKQGLKVANSETCLPLKVMYGHVIELKDKVDFLLLPQMDRVKWGENKPGTATYFCPYFVGMADVMEAEFERLKVLRPRMSFSEFQIDSEPWLELAKELGQNDQIAKEAVEAAQYAQEKFLAKKWSGKTPIEILEQTPINECGDNPPSPKSLGSLRRSEASAARGTIALVGRSYIIYDGQASLDLIQKINDRGYKVRTLETVPGKILQENWSQMDWSRQSHWCLTNQEFGAIIYFSKQTDVDGIIYVTPFNCGPDFLIEEFVISQSRKQKPISIVSMDESTGEAGLTTRIDAFLDMLKKK